MSREEAFAEKIRETLEASEQNLNAHEISRLRAARIAALEQRQKRRAWFEQTWFKPAAAIACAALIAVGVWVNWPGPTTLEYDGEALEMIASEESLEFFEEYDFYVWLAEEDVG